jgi:hypothetical protein
MINRSILFVKCVIKSLFALSSRKLILLKTKTFNYFIVKYVKVDYEWKHYFSIRREIFISQLTQIWDILKNKGLRFRLFTYCIIFFTLNTLLITVNFKHFSHLIFTLNVNWIYLIWKSLKCLHSRNQLWAKGGPQVFENISVGLKGWEK